MSDFSIMLCLRACAVLFVVVASDDDMLISVSEDGERFVGFLAQEIQRYEGLSLE